MITAFEVLAKLGLDDSSFRQGIDKAEKSGKNFSNSLSDSFGKIKKAAAAIVSVAVIKKGIDAIGELASATAAAGDKIDKQSQVLGMSRKAYQEWDYILSQNGSSIESMSVAMKTLNSTILNGVEGNKEAADSFAQLGLHINGLNMMSQEDQFEAVVRAFQKMPAGAQKSALAVKLFGRQGMQLLPLLNNSATSIDELRKKASELGLIMSDEAVDASVKYTDSLDTMKRSFNALKYSIGSKILPILTTGMQKITNYAGKLKKAYDDRGLAGVWDTIKESFSNIRWPTWDEVKTALVNAWNGVKEGAKSVLKLVFGETPDGGIAWPSPDEMWAKVKSGLETLWGGIKSFASSVLKLVFGEDENGGIDWGSADEIWYKVGAGLRTLWDGIKRLAGNILTLVFGSGPDGGIQFPSAEETYRAIGNALATWWTGVRRLCKGVLNLLLGALGLPDIDEVVRQIKEWWGQIKQKIALKLFVSIGGYKGLGYDPSKGETWSEGVRSTNEKFGIHLPQLSDEDIERYTDESFAKGSWSVPYDDFIAKLHRGETVLTASQARDYRNGNEGGSIDFGKLSSTIASAMQSAIENATIRSYINGKDVTDEVTRTTMRAIKARRFAT